MRIQWWTFGALQSDKKAFFSVKILPPFCSCSFVIMTLEPLETSRGWWGTFLPLTRCTQGSSIPLGWLTGEWIEADLAVLQVKMVWLEFPGRFAMLNYLVFFFFFSPSVQLLLTHTSLFLFLQLWSALTQPTYHLFFSSLSFWEYNPQKNTTKRSLLSA